MTGFLAAPSPRWFSIAPHRPFLDDLAKGMWRELAPGGPEALADAMVLLPNRRAVRALADAFLGCAAGRAVLPPRIRALGDLDEGEPPFEPGDLALDLPPAIGTQRRRFELAGLVIEHQDLLDRTLDAAAALDLADALAAFLDTVQIEEADIDLAAAVEGDFAAHWRRSADFLDVALWVWPKRLAELGLIDVAARRVALIRRLEARWRDSPPAEVVVAAGSTGSTKATADLLSAIAASPRGAVVLPGLDHSLAESAWAAEDDQHPQSSLQRLLRRAGIPRADVRLWEGSEETVDAARWRRRVINEALRPAELTADWLTVIEELRRESPGADPIALGAAGLSLVSARDEEEAAAACAIMLREALETPERTAALVTPDAILARRVAAHLSRWSIVADSSVGQPLALAPQAVLARLLSRAVVDPTDPVTLLGIAKHPVTRLGLPPNAFRGARERLEALALRGPRAKDWRALSARLETAPEAIDLADRLRAAIGIAAAAFNNGVAVAGQAAAALAEALERLAEAPEGGRLWLGQGGGGLAAVLARLIEDSDSLPPVTPAGFTQLMDGLLTRELVRPGGATHPRLRILGVLEARLARADLTILAGLEEGMWPSAASVDPFLSRPMRKNLGLPTPERRIGLAAHDFAQAACAPEVVLLNTQRRGGAPTVPSRWIWRLETLFAGARVTPSTRPEALDWARALDAPIADPPPSLRTAQRPAPRPPVAARPRQLPVTAVETWVRDPYAVYARRILRLRPVDPPDAPVDARVRGTAVHAAFERFAKGYPDLPNDADHLFEALLLEALSEAGMPEAKMVREAALARTLAPWVVDFERQRRPGARLLVEQTGQMDLSGPAGAFVLTAKADRIELRGAEADILDFKTGAAPTTKQVDAGLSPQLTLTAAILDAGGFQGAGTVAPRELVYVRVRGGRIPGQVEKRDGGDAAGLAAEALAGLSRRIARFDQEATAYVSRSAVQYIGDAGDYDDLARLWEWATIGELET